MTVVTKDQVDRFLTLQSKSNDELGEILKALNCFLVVPVSSKNRWEAIDLIIRETDKVKEEAFTFKPCAIPLSTRDSNSKPLNEAIEAMKTWRKMIFEARYNKKEFELLNSRGNTYKLSMKYIKCSGRLFQHMVNKKWFLPVLQQKPVLDLVNKNPEDFDISIIQKPDAKGNSWLMVHLQKKDQSNVSQG